MKRRLSVLLALIMALSVFVTPVASATGKNDATANLVETAIAANGGLPADTGGAGDFDLLISALLFAGDNGVDLLGTLSGGSFAVFAPTDQAFIDLAGGVPEDQVLATLIPVLTSVYGDPVAGLVDVLTYHVAPWDGGRRLVRGNTDMVNGDDAAIYRRWIKDATGAWAKVTAGPIYATNGYINVINKVILPEAFNPSLVEAAIAANGGLPSETGGTGNFDLLIGALLFAGDSGVDLIGTLNGGDFVVYAPTDQAFIDLAGGVPEDQVLATLIPVLTSVYGDPVAGLVDVLTYHVTAFDGKRPFGRTQMVNGENTRIYWRWMQDATRNWVRITDGPIEASNGQLYVINEVLLPGAFA